MFVQSIKLNRQSQEAPQDVTINFKQFLGNCGIQKFEKIKAINQSSLILQLVKEQNEESNLKIEDVKLFCDGCSCKLQC